MHNSRKNNSRPASNQRAALWKSYKDAFVGCKDLTLATIAANALLSGHDCKQDLELAVSYAKKAESFLAAYKGDPVFQLNEQVCLLVSEINEVQIACAKVGLMPDPAVNPKEVLDDLLKYEQRGYGIVYNALGKVYECMSEKEDAYEATLSATDFDNTDASCRLGRYYKDGYGTERNLEYACNAYEFAIVNGSEQAVQGLEECREEQTQVLMQRPLSSVRKRSGSPLARRLEMAAPKRAARRPAGLFPNNSVEDEFSPIPFRI